MWIILISLALLMSIGVGVSMARHLSGSVGLYPINTVLPAITGTLGQGNVLTCSTGTWTNSPTTFAYQWYRIATGGGSATAVGTNASTYTQQSADVAFNVYCVVTASNASGNGAATSNTVGPVTGAGLNAPTYALHTASGVSPASWDVTGDSTFQPGLWVHQQFATNSGFTTGLVDYYTQVNASDWEATSESIGGGASVGIAGAAQTFVQPTGTYFTRCRFETAPGDVTNNVTSAWSNTVTDTINSVTTVWNAGTASTHLTISGSPALVVSGPGAGFNGAPCWVRATNAQTGKRHFEVALTTLASTNPNYIGIEDGTTSWASTFPNPPSSFTGYRTDGVIYKNGSVLAGTTVGAQGNVVEIEFDQAGATMNVFLNGTQLGSQITGLTASAFYAAAASEDANTLTGNFGQNTFAMTPTTGYQKFT